MAVEQLSRRFFLARTAALALLATGVLGEPAVNVNCLRSENIMQYYGNYTFKYVRVNL